MKAADRNILQEIFARILKKLGEMGDFFTVASELSKPGTAAHNRLLSLLLTRPEHANLKARYGDEDFFHLITKLANLDQEHKIAGLPDDTKPSSQVKPLLEDKGLLALVSILAKEGDLSTAVKFLQANPSVTHLLADNSAQQLVVKMTNDGLYHVTEKLATDATMVGRLADDTTPFFVTLQVLAKHPEMDGLLAEILRLLANDPDVHALPEDEDFARLVVDLAGSQAVKDISRRGQFFDLVRGFSVEEESQKLAYKILFTARFPQVAFELARNEKLTDIVRLMLTDEHFKKVAEMLAAADSSRLLIDVAEKPDFAETVRRMQEDEIHPDGFNDLVKKLRTNDDHLYEQVKRLSEDRLFREIHASLPDGPLTAEKLALLLNELGNRLHEDREYDRAITSFKLAQTLDPLLRDAYLGHADACNAKGFHTMAVEDLSTLIAKNDRDTAAYLGRGRTYLTLAMYDEAQVDFLKVLDLSIDDDERNLAEEGLSAINKRKKMKVT